MWRTVPRRPWAHGALVAIAALALAQMGAGPGKKKKEGLPPKVQETVGDLSFVVSRGEMKVEGVGLVVGLDDTGVDPPSSWLSQTTRRRDEQGRRRESREASDQSPGLDGDRAAHDPRRSRSQGPARRSG